MTDAEAQDWMIERRRRARDTIVEHTREVREIKDIPPELLSRMDAIEQAYAEHLAWKNRVVALETRADKSDERQMMLAQTVAELVNYVQGRPSAIAGGDTAVAIRMEQPQILAPDDDLMECVRGLQEAVLRVTANLTSQIGIIGDQVDRQKAEMKQFAEAFLQVKEAARRLG